jgi:outer membrane protein assembly factor BamB
MLVSSLVCWLAMLSGFQEPVANWPEFRGGKSGGVIEDGTLPDSWSTTKNVRWKTEIPGRGWSSPIIWGDKVFVASVIRQGKEDVAKKGLYFGGERSKPPAEEHQWMVYAIGLDSGKILWEKLAHQGVPQSTHHVKNSYASETPVTDGERVYVSFGNLGVFCYDLDGNEIWTRKWEPMPTAWGWGPAASPVIYKDRLIVVNDNEKKSFMVALDARTGHEIWKVDRDEKSNWATPFIWENDKRTEIITCGNKKVRSYDLDGNPLWELGGMSKIVIPTPLAKFGMLYITSGYVMDQVRPIFAIKPGASGDITLAKNQTSNDWITWFQKQGGPYNPSPIIYGDNVYVLYDRGFLGCFDAKTGAENYHMERIASQPFTASPWAGNGKIFCLSEDGDTFVIQAGTKYKLIGKNSLDELSLATPAFARGNLLIRTETKLYCIRNLTQ